MIRFCLVCEAIAATTKKLEKEKLLAEYFRDSGSGTRDSQIGAPSPESGITSPDETLAIACVFLAGSPFPLRDQRTTNTGFAAIRDALIAIDPQVEGSLGPALLRTGDPGTALQELLAHKNTPPTLTLKQVLSYFERLSSSGGARQKRELLAELFQQATPLEIKYLVKILLGDLRIGLQESLVESSLARTFSQPLALVQRANMLLGDIGECAVLCKHGRLHQAQLRLLHPLKPMLASPEENVSKILEYMKGEGLAEDKYDGIRAQVHKQGEDLKIYSRDLADITQSFPDAINALTAIPHSFVMDGEMLGWKDGRILTFAEMQTRIGRKSLTAELLESVPCRYFAFDLLFYDGELLMDRPLRERRKALEAIAAEFPHALELSIQKIVREESEIEEAFATSRNRNNEGLVIKDPASLYTPGKRGKTWLKLKRAQLTLDVVVTAAEYGHGKRRGLLSDYTFAVQHEGKLLDIGKAYSGITDQELNQLSETFHRISIENHGWYHVVPPQVVLEITFDRINRSNRHSSGFALRFPRIKNIRWDKKPEEIDTLKTVEQLYQQHFVQNNS